MLKYMSLNVRVTPFLDSHTFDVNKFVGLPLYMGKIAGEIPPPTPVCFLGSWYRKAFSSYDYWLGVEGVIRLGEFYPDPVRFNLDGKGRHMDNPSVYMGGRSAKESDAGLTYAVMYPDADTSYDLTAAAPKLGYRPFWRNIYYEEEDIGGNVTRREVNSWNMADPRNPAYYYFPGDILRMSVYTPVKDYLQLRIELLEPSPAEKYRRLRKAYRLSGNIPVFLSPCFYSHGHGCERAEFKRVNAVDQYGNEGYRAQPTAARVSEAVWDEVFLYRKMEGHIMRVPFGSDRQCSMICPDERAIKLSPFNDVLGGEKIIIQPEATGKEKK